MLWTRSGIAEHRPTAVIVDMLVRRSDGCFLRLRNASQITLSVDEVETSGAFTAAAASGSQHQQPWLSLDIAIASYRLVRVTYA